MTKPPEGEFSVAVFFNNGTHVYDLRWVDGRTAVYRLKTLSETVGARTGMIVKIIVTDGDDNTNVEWRHGKGLTYPTKDELQ